MRKKSIKKASKDEGRYLTTTQAANFCNVTRFTIRNWANDGKLKIKQTSGGHRRILMDDLREFIHKNDIPADLSSGDAVLTPRCYDHKKFRNSDSHDCESCLVFKEKAAKCFLLIKELGSEKVQCRHDCLTCEYLGMYFPREQKILIKDRTKKNASVPHCYDVQDLVCSDEHDCSDCLVFKEKAYKCFMVTRQFGEHKVLCGHDCEHCEYMKKYFPRDWKVFVDVQSGKSDKNVEKRSKINIETKDENINMGLYKSGKYLASVTNFLSGKKKKAS